MANFSYENQGTNTYLVYSVGENETIDQMGIGMLTNNRVAGLAETLYTQMNTDRYIKYNVTAKIPARGYLDGIVSRKRLLGVFNGIVSAILNAEDYMIPIEMMVLDLDYIFVDVSNSETLIICLPVPRKDARDLKMFLKEIVLSAQYNPQENCDYVAKLMNVLNSPASLSLVAFKELLDELSKENEGTNSLGSKPISVTPMEKNKTTDASTEIQTPVSNISTSNQIPITPLSAPAQNVMPLENNAIQEQLVTDSSVEEISLGYLLAHYSKENAAKYKAYKDAQKANVSANSKSVKTTPDKRATSKACAPQAGFAIPGQNSQQNSNGFAIPGQPIIAPNGQAYTYPSKHAPQAKAVTPIPAPKASKQASVQPYAAPVQSPVVQQRKSSPKQESSLDFGETVMLGLGTEDNATVMLSNVSSFSPYFLRVSTGEKVRITKPLFHLGREQSYVDYVINNSAVGRSHADVVLSEEKIFVIDMNSTNHTYVNGAMIASGVQIPVEHGDKLKLANEEFEVHYY